MNDIEFPEGLWAKMPPEGAPDFVICAINIKRDDFMKFVAEKDGDYLNLQVLRSRAGDKYYAKVDNWKPTQAAVPKVADPVTTTVQGGSFEEDTDIPF
jgi:hypothetical protein